MQRPENRGRREHRTEKGGGRVIFIDRRGTFSTPASGVVLNSMASARVGAKVYHYFPPGILLSPSTVVAIRHNLKFLP